MVSRNTKYIVLSSILATLLTGCATQNTPVYLDGTETTPYCAQQLGNLKAQNQTIIERFNYLADSESVAPFMSRDYKTKEAEFFEYTEKSIKPFLNGDLGVPGALSNNNVCGTIFNYAFKEQEIVNKYLDKATQTLSNQNELYYKNIKTADGSSGNYSAGIISYNNFVDDNTDNQDRAKSAIKLNRVNYIDYVTTLK